MTPWGKGYHCLQRGRIPFSAGVYVFVLEKATGILRKVGPDRLLRVSRDYSKVNTTNAAKVQRRPIRR